MSPVVHAGLAKLPEADVRAIAVYFADRFGPAADAADTTATLAKALASGTPVIGQPTPHGEQLYAAACGSCHFNSGPMPLLLRPELGLNSALSASDPSNLLQVILHGVGVEEGLPGVMMPGFAHALSNEQVAELAAWLRSQRTGLAPWPDLAARVDALNPPSPPAP
jgi:mono/diheme cytochrome c family protein